MLTTVNKLGVYRHKGTGKLYIVVATADLESDGTFMVVYVSIGSSRHWVRPFREFAEKFEEADLQEKPEE